MEIKSAEELITMFPQAVGIKEQIDKVSKEYPFMVSDYYARLIDWNDKNCPIFLQAIPNEKELDDQKLTNDPLAEEKYSKGKCIVHRYYDRVLFLVTDTCFSYCRHCTRKRMVGRQTPFTIDDWDEGIEYIKKHPQIRDVILSGGDPLTLSDGDIEYLISELHSIAHIEIIRIGTRTIVTNPKRFTPSLIKILKKYKPIWINTHFNHPKEITFLASKTIDRIIDAGIPIGNQTVLLKGINDNEEILLELFKKLVQNRVRPYYLYHCDVAKGVNHFRTNIQDGMKIYNNLLNRTTGFAIPKYVIDLPNGGGKVPVSLDYLCFIDNETILIRNYEGRSFEYKNPIVK